MMETIILIGLVALLGMMFSWMFLTICDIHRKVVDIEARLQSGAEYLRKR